MSSVQSSASQPTPAAARQVAFVGEAGDPGEEGAVAAGGAEGAVREHNPWGLLVAHVTACGGAPRAADGADAGAVAGERKARDDTGYQEVRRKVGPS